MPASTPAGAFYPGRLATYNDPGHGRNDGKTGIVTAAEEDTITLAIPAPGTRHGAVTVTAPSGHFAKARPARTVLKPGDLVEYHSGRGIVVKVKRHCDMPDGVVTARIYPDGSARSVLVITGRRDFIRITPITEQSASS
jgi:hypothetical protein